MPVINSTSEVNDEDTYVPLLMQCEDEELSSVQVEMYKKLEEERKYFMQKLDEIVALQNGQIILKGTYSTIYELSASVQLEQQHASNISKPASANVGLIKPAPTASLLAEPSEVQPLLAKDPFFQTGSRNSTGFGSGYKLVVLPKQSQPSPFVVNSSPVTNQNKVGNPIVCTALSRTVVAPTTTIAHRRTAATTSGNAVQSTLATSSVVASQSSASVTKPVAKVRGKSKNTQALATETDGVVDLTDDDNVQINCEGSSINNAPFEADSREVTFSRFPGKTYPSLVVVARPNIKLKDMTSSEITEERACLDSKVKAILMNPPPKFTEWMLQQGLLCCEQVCSTHVDVNCQPVKFKLGMYSDASKFPHSGGYVWISDCCPLKFVSVFNGSIFEGSPHSPTILFKLIYHWACQTSINNIIAWVKGVDNLYVKNFFSYLRAVCTAVLCEKFEKMGGYQKKIEVGVISLGTTSTNGQMRQVKVEVLGVMDPETKHVRLRAIDPIQNGQKNNCKERFSRILKILEQWVHKDTIILTDYTVDKNTIMQLGFPNVIQAHINSRTSESNQTVMEYLKRIVPRMFQNTLSLLNTRIIQQFLDELVWRERWGPIASRAFDNIVAHIIEQTKLDTGDTLLNRMHKITMDPFKDWRYSKWQFNCGVVVTRKQMTAASNQNTVVATNRSIIPNSRKNQPAITAVDQVMAAAMAMCTNTTTTTSGRSTNQESATIYKPQIKCVISSTMNPLLQLLNSLEIYYYGTLPPDKLIISELKKVMLNMKCPVCGILYNNNITFMKHLVGHALNEGAFTTDHQCKYCLQNFTSTEQLDDHMALDHTCPPNMVSCLICEEKFSGRVALIQHMHSAHTKLELPYQCDICKYRSSQHQKVVDHFYEVHEFGGKVLCPLCLKLVTLDSNGRKITANISFFIGHIQRHQKKSCIHKCDRCVLQFVKKSGLKAHKSKEHNSCSVEGVVRGESSVYDTMMPIPPSVTKDSKKLKTIPPTLVSSYTINKYENTSRPIKPNSVCIECCKPANTTSHFSSYLSCMRCVYATCCTDAMKMHIDMIHDLKISHTLETYKSDGDLYCACGFSSFNHDECAKHLVICNKRRTTLYGSLESASASNSSVGKQSASFPALVHLDATADDADAAVRDLWLQKPTSSTADDAANKKSQSNEGSTTEGSCMLNVLGLMRRSDSTDDNNSKDGMEENKETTTEQSATAESEKNIASPAKSTGSDSVEITSCEPPTLNEKSNNSNCAASEFQKDCIRDESVITSCPDAIKMDTDDDFSPTSNQMDKMDVQDEACSVMDFEETEDTSTTMAVDPDTPSENFM